MQTQLWRNAVTLHQNCPLSEGFGGDIVEGPELMLQIWAFYDDEVCPPVRGKAGGRMK